MLNWSFLTSFTMWWHVTNQTKQIVYYIVEGVNPPMLTYKLFIVGLNLNYWSKL